MEKIETADWKVFDTWRDRDKDKQLVARVEYYENGNVKLIEYMPPLLITLPQGKVKIDRIVPEWHNILIGFAVLVFWGIVALVICRIATGL